MPNLLSSYHDVARRLGVPAGSTIELLAPCNLRCPHCYVTHNAKNQLTLPVLQSLLEQMRAMGSFYVSFTGGEVGLRRDLFEIIAMARDLRFAVYLLTSGTRFGPAEWDRLARLAVNGVQISVYGATACTHDEATQVEGSFEKTMATIDALIDRGIEVEISTPVMAVNAHEAADVLQWAQGRGLTVKFDPNIQAMDSGDMRPKETLASADALATFFGDPRFQSYFASGKPDAACNVPSDDGRPCGTGEVASFVRCTGEVYPCAVWPESGGNILSRSFKEIWFESPVFLEARAVRYGSVPACGGCGDRGFCSPCAAMNKQDHGRVSEPSSTICDTAGALAKAVRGFSHQPHRTSTHTSSPVLRGAPGSRLPIVA